MLIIRNATDDNQTRDLRSPTGPKGGLHAQRLTTFDSKPAPLGRSLERDVWHRTLAPHLGGTMNRKRLKMLAVLIAAFVIPVFVHSEAWAVACGDAIGSSTNLSTSITGCTGNGLTISANDVAITCDSGVEISGDGVGSDVGILVNGRSGFQTSGCKISGFHRGIEAVDSSAGTITSSEITTNTLYGIALIRSTGFTVEGNEVSSSGNEGIHITGQLNNNACPSPHPGENIVSSNTITGSGEEAIYVLCSDSNRIESNETENNGQAGIFVDNQSTSNLVIANELKNDALMIKASSNNSIVNNVIEDSDAVSSPPAFLRFTGASSNYAEGNTVIGDATITPDYCYSFQDDTDPSPALPATCNQFAQSSCSAPDVADIQASGGSLNNRFFQYSRSTDPDLCVLSGTSTVNVYDGSNTLIGCAGSSPVAPGACTWWAFDELCDDGSTNTLGDVQANAATWDLDDTTISDTQYYRANTGAVRLSITDPVIVASTGCLSVSAATTVELLPGTSIDGRFRAIVQ